VFTHGELSLTVAGNTYHICFSAQAVLEIGVLQV
jgi:hypothetical protein